MAGPSPTLTPVPAAPKQPEQWTTRRLLAWMTSAFTKKGLDSPRLFAEMLVAHVLGCERLRLYMDPDRPATPEERDRLRTLVGRALEHEPVQYLVGEGWFFGMPFTVDRRVLVPRPSTETAVEHIIQHARAEGRPKGEDLLIADVCTGSGCIAVALLKNLPEARAVATDLSEDALDVARRNADRHGVTDRIEFLAGDALEPLADHPPTARKGAIHYLVSNPPYIPDDEWRDVPPNVKRHEPALALRGGKDGLDIVRRVIEGAAPLLAPGGLLLVETAASRAEQTRALAEQIPELSSAQILHDADGLPRLLLAHRALKNARSNKPPASTTTAGAPITPAPPTDIAD